MSIDVRLTRPEEYRIASDAMAAALLTGPADDETWERSAPSWNEMISFSAWDGDRCAGHAGQFLVDTTVPGGVRLPSAAVTRVGVLPTYRRQGLARRLIEACVNDAVERNLALMSLRASEAVIYQRFGFGMAGEFVDAAIDPDKLRPLAGAGAAGGTFELLARDRLLGVIEPLYDRVGHRRPGAITRPPSFWQRYFRDAVSGSKASFVVVHRDDQGEPDGYAHYDVEWSEDPDASGGKGEVFDVFGSTDAVELALWGFVLDVDLVRTWRAEERPLDDVLRTAARDRRGYAVKAVADEQWLRIVDVDVALAGRAYNAAGGGVVVRVVDPLVHRNNGTWRIDSTGSAPTSEQPDLVAGITTLSAAYLGGTSWRALVATGQAQQPTRGAADTADALFAARPLPYCGSFF